MSKKSPSIRMHKEFGLNPTMPICIVCQEEKGEIALLGASYKGEAPRTMLLDIEPCEKCRKKYLEEQKGVLLVEMQSDERTPTGRVAIIKEDGFKNIFSQDIPSQRIVRVEEGLLSQIGVAT